jgi:hypothetical protein
MDCATARQRHRQRIAVKGNDQRRLRQCGDRDRAVLTDADRNADCPRQITPKLAYGPMGVTPQLYVGLQLGIGASVINDNAAQGSDRSAIAAGEIGGLTPFAGPPY